MSDQNQLFRKKTMDRISSPEELHDYMRVTSPRLWMILSAILILLAGFVIYAATTRMESTEKVTLRKFGSNYGSARIPAGREDLIKIGMEVRVAGKTGQVTQIENRMEYVLDVTFDGNAPTEDSYYAISLGEDKDLDNMDEDGDEVPDLIYVLREDGLFFLLDAGSTADAFTESDSRARFWREEYVGDSYKLTEGRLATVHRVNRIIATTAFITMDEPDTLGEGIYEAEIVTETTTPINFLMN